MQRFAREISLRLRALCPEAVFLCPPNIVDRPMAARLDAQVIGTATGHRWEQWTLPAHLRANGSPLLLNLTSTAPILYRNQIATLHDINFVRNPQSFSFRFRAFYRILIPLMLKRTDALITVSQFSKREISDFYRFPSDKICVVPNAVDRHLFRPQRGERKSTQVPYFLAVSSTNYHKNFGRLVEAFSSLKLEEEVQLFVVGGHNASFSASAGRIPHADNIRFLGRVDDVQLGNLYANALAFVFPSLYEGFGIPPLEAQACGCPVLASSATSIPEVVEKSAVLFNPTDVREIALALERVAVDAPLRDRLVQAGLRNVDRFDWGLSAQRVLDLVRAGLRSG